MRKLHCSNCAQPLRAVSLTAHYDRQVEVDVCDPCCLIWFDDVESVRIAKPGIAELVKVVHAAMSKGESHGGAASLAARQHCPMCSEPLRQVFNASRYGRTSQLQCPNGHGYYQSYILYLAEKGYLRPVIWADIKALVDNARELFCGNCGGHLELRPQDECPYCRSAISVLDPARLAAAVDAGPAEVQAKSGQHACHACGGPVDPTQDTSCPQCHAPVRRRDTALAMEAVSRPRARPSTEETFAKMDVVLARAVVEPPRMVLRMNSLPFRLMLGMIGMGLLFSLKSCMEKKPVQPVVQEPAISAPAPAAAAAVQETGNACGRRSVRVRALVIHGVEGSPTLLEHVAKARSAWDGGMPFAEVQRLYARSGIDRPSIGPEISRPLSRDDLPEALADVAFCQQLQVISQPVYSKDSYYILQVMQAN